MNSSDLEQIVAEVVRRLMAAGGDGSSSEPKTPTASLASVGGTSGMPVDTARKVSDGMHTGANGVLTSDDRVLSLATLDGKLDGLRRIVVQRKAIVTPALREELSRRGIELDRGGVAGSKKVVVDVAAVRFDAERAPSLHGLGLAEDITVKTAAEMVKAVVWQVEHNKRLALVLTRQTAVALCALNRKSNVRAAVATNAESVRMAARSIGANVLVVDPSHLGRVQAAAIVRALENAGSPSVPGELKEVV